MHVSINRHDGAHDLTRYNPVSCVTVPPKKVELLYFSGGETKLVAEEGQLITLEENQDGGFECRIEVCITLL